VAGKILVYGSYGYTGDLIARFAKEDGVDVVLCGRNAERLREQAERYGFDSVTADVSDPESIREALRDADVVVHCAGAAPFVVMENWCMSLRLGRRG